jgi:hypothetical protein
MPGYNIFAGFAAMLLKIARQVAIKILVAGWLACWLAVYDVYATGLDILSGYAGCFLMLAGWRFILAVWLAKLADFAGNAG